MQRDRVSDEVGINFDIKFNSGNCNVVLQELPQEAIPLNILQTGMQNIKSSNNLDYGLNKT